MVLSLIRSKRRRLQARLRHGAARSPLPDRDAVPAVKRDRGLAIQFKIVTQVSLSLTDIYPFAFRNCRYKRQDRYARLSAC